VQQAQAEKLPQDLKLIAAVRSGDEDGMAQLYDRYSGIVYSVALRVLGDTGAAEDVLQEVFMQLWRTPAAFDSARGSLGAWLVVIARNRAIDALRKRRPESDVEEVVISLPCHLDDETARKQLIERVRAAMSGMPQEQSAALDMAFFQGLTHTEIARSTGEPLGTIKTRIRSALMTLRKAVAA
jgi:RNA polymerase sigma-70 factor (ECF subfamily)